MKGPNHQQFFDGQRGNLERYLELLNKKNEVNWYEEVLEVNVINPSQTKHVGQKFFAYKQELAHLEKTLRNFFEKILLEIERDFPDVMEAEDYDPDDVGEVALVGQWTCRLCTHKNDMKEEKCRQCVSCG